MALDSKQTDAQNVHLVVSEGRMEQREVWDSIAEQWQKFRVKAYDDVKEFLSGRHGTVLDLGCGSGRNFLAGRKYIGIDFSEKMLRYAKEHAKKNNIEVYLIKADVSRLPLKPDLFDTVMLVAALHVTKKRQEALKEMRRVMKKGGEAFVTVWNKSQPRFAFAKKESFIPWKYDGKTHWRYYYLFTKRELKSLMSKYFSMREIRGSKEKALKLFSKNIIAIVRKRG